MKTFCFTFICSQFDLSPELMDKFYEAGCDDATFANSRKKTYITFGRKAESLDEAVRSAVEDLFKVQVVYIEERIVENDLGRYGLQPSPVVITALSKLKDYISDLKSIDKRFKRTVHVTLEDGTSYIVKNSFLVIIDKTWLGIISQHQFPQVHHLDEVTFYQQYEIVNEIEEF